MELTAREIAVLGILICCVPLQLYLSQLSSLNKEERTFKLQEIMLDSKFKLQALFSPSLWAVWFREIQRTWFIKDYSHWYPDNEDPLGECPAVESLKARFPDGYFATSVQPRESRPTGVHWRVGQVIRHKKYGYIGVITGWDRTCRAPESWIKKMHGDNTEWRTQPNYSVLVDTRYREEPQTTYVIQENIEVIKNQIAHPDLANYFDYYDGAQYIPQPWLKSIYPSD